MSGAARWIVRAGDGERVADVLARLGAGERNAASEGRAFLNGRRASPDDAIKPDDELLVWSARDEVSSADPSEDDQTRILARWGELVAAYKPPSLPTTPDRRGDRSLVLEVKRLLEARKGTPARSPAASADRIPHAASRLDVGVSGVVLCALGRRGQAHIEAMRAEGRVRRVYVAIAAGALSGSGLWDAPIGRVHTPPGRMKPVALGRNAEAATTRYRVLAHAAHANPSAEARMGEDARARATLLLVEPITGRMHQIRVHASNAGAPLLGDREHGGPRSIVDAEGRVHAVSRIALHALSVELPGERGETRVAVAPIPAELRRLWKILDGPDVPWNDLATSAVSSGTGS